MKLDFKKVAENINRVNWHAVLSSIKVNKQAQIILLLFCINTIFKPCSHIPFIHVFSALCFGSTYVNSYISMKIIAMQKTHA